MSLIEEALRKHREEQATQKPPVPPQVGAPSTSDNPSAAPETRAPSKRRVLLVGLNLLLVVGVLAMIVWGSLNLLKRSGRLFMPIASQITGRAASLSGPTATITLATANPPRLTNAVAVTNRTPALRAATLTNGLVTATSITVAIAASTSQPSARVTAAATPIIALPPPEPPRPGWPRLTVTGIMEAPGNRSTAIVNGKLLGQGDTVQGAKITAITKDGVRFEYGGETRRIRIGNAAD